MYDRERFAETSYAAYGLESEEGPKEKAARLARKHAPMIVLAVVAIAGGLFFYDFLIGSIRAVDFSIKNTEGDELRDSSIKIYTTSGEEIFVSAGKPTHATELRKGTYSADITATGYELKREQITISDTPNTSIVLEKNIRAEILSPKDNFPHSLVSGQVTQGRLTVENNGSGAIESYFVFEGDLKNLIINALPSPLVVPPQSTATAIIEIQVPREIQVKEKTGDALKGSVRLKFTKKKYDLEARLYPTPVLELKEIDFGRLKAGASGIDKDASVRNKSGFPVTDLMLGIEITSAPINKPSEVIKWFKFTEIADAENPALINVPVIEKSALVTKKLRVDIPLAAKKEVISGNIVLSASFLAQDIKKPLTVEVSEETNIGLTASARPDTISISWVEAQGKYEEKPLAVEFTNTGTLPLKNILLSVKNTATCHTGWLRIAEQTIAELKPRENRELTLFATAPVSQKSNETTMNCKLRHKYDNPTPTGPTFIEAEIEGFVAITPRPS